MGLAKVPPNIEVLRKKQMTAKNIESNKKYWDEFYATSHRHLPSQFCALILTEIKEGTVVVELGSGNGRDSHFFADQGHTSVAVDLSAQAIKTSSEFAASRKVDHANFLQADLTSKTDLEVAFKTARDQAGDNEIVYYSRFVMHTLDDDQELAFLEILGGLMKSGETIYFEFRSKEDAELEKIHGNHFRRYVDTDLFKNYLTEKFGFEIKYSITGQGMAKYKTEDPVVSRVFAQKK
ncbi:MAG: class I SAM-dependent methyltransferase [SAR324 cluster bacterium]|nr:class I SAM-dependent methyltransferase [SAR324 cluster bacterium]